MKRAIKDRIDAIRRGEVPKGYCRTRAGLMPLDWQGNLVAKDVFQNHTNKKHNGEFEVLSATQDRGIIPRNEVDIQYSESNIESYKKVDPGDFIISLRSFQGGIEYSEYEGLVSPAYTVLKPKQLIIDNYYRAYFKTSDFINKLNGAIYGIRDGKQIGFEDFGELAIHYPPLAEQKKISEILDHCDKLIKRCEAKVDEYKSLKKTCLSKMFPQNSSNVPELRFPGFTGAWEQRKLSDEFSDFIVPMRDKPKEFGGNIPWTRIEDIKGKYLNGSLSGQFVSEETIKQMNLKIIPKDSLIVSSSATFGVAAIITQDLITNQTFIGLVPKDKDTLDFWYTFFHSAEARNYMRLQSAGSTIFYIAREHFEKMPIKVPTKDEMFKIGKYFSDIDRLITLHQREVEEYTQLKKAMTQLLLTGIVRVNT